MKSGVKSFAAILIIAACLKAEAQFSTSAGSGGVAITPRGMSFKNRPEMRISRNSVSLSQTSRSLQPKDAVKILKSTNLVTGAKLGDNGEISQQTLALASLLFYPNKETALASFVEIFNSAENAEGKIYGAMGIYYFEGRNALEKILEDKLPADSAARQSIPANGFIIIADSLNSAAEIAGKKAPEHLELALNPGEERDRLVSSLTNYGSLFIGHKSAEVLGDYAAGLNHTLPTAGTAAFTGGLSVRHFIKTVTTLRCGEKTNENLSGWKASLAAAETLALSEGLTGHALAAGIRKTGE